MGWCGVEVGAVINMGNGLVWSGGCIREFSEYPCEYALPV